MNSRSQEGGPEPRTAPPVPGSWTEVCRLEEILPDTGVCALVAGRQVAIFRLAGGSVHAIGARDPFSGANVLARGIVGDLQGEIVVASPLYKQHFSLRTGRCLEEPAVSVPVYAVRVEGGAVWVRIPRASGRAPERRPRIVVVGGGMAAAALIEELCALAPQRYAITVFGAEPHPPYNRSLLSAALAGDIARAQLFTRAREWYARTGVALHTGDPVVRIDRARREVVARSGRTVPYHRLVLATGARPLALALPGAELAGVRSFRDLGDLEALLEASRRRGAAVVIGGGVLGLELACALRARGMAVTVVHGTERLMERQLDAYGAQLLQQRLEAAGLKVLLGARVEAIVGAGRARAVRIEGGRELPADLVVVATGIVPEIGLARSAGLPCGRGVLVGDTLQSFDPAIYALGDCAQHRGASYGLVAPLREQARVCADHLAGRGARAYRGSVAAVRFRAAGWEVFSAGSVSGGAGARDLVYKDSGRGFYRKLVLREDRLEGVVLVGETADCDWYLGLIERGAEVGRYGEGLLFGRRYAEPRAA